MIDISVVIPVYGCKEAIPELYDRLSKSLQTITKEYEIILVDDRCPQNSWEDIVQICDTDKRVHGVRLSRNFGQHKAIKAGLDRAKGKYIVTMDCDLQDRPEDISLFYSKAQEGFDVVIKKRKSRTETKITLFFSRLFYKFYNYFTDGSYDGELSSFCLISRKVADQISHFSEHSFDYILLVRWLGFDTITIELDDEPRHSGTSSYSFRKKVNMAFELITEYSNKPLLFAIKIGGCVSFIACLYIIYIVLRYLLIKDLNVGWSSMVASVYLIGGLILSAIGMVGVYIGSIFDEIKNRPIYAVQEEINGEIKEKSEN